MVGFDAGGVLRQGTKRPFSPHIRFLTNYLFSQYVLSFVFADLPFDALCFQHVLSFVFCGHSVPAWNAALPGWPMHRASLTSLRKLHKAKLAQSREIVKREVRTEVTWPNAWHQLPFGIEPQIGHRFVQTRTPSARGGRLGKPPHGSGGWPETEPRASAAMGGGAELTAR